VNPIAMMESACMMLDHINEAGIAKKIRNSIAQVIREGKVRTYDMKKMAGSADVIQKGAASTRQMADAIIAKL
jgi:3-isopropylmalate dehydrogenase